MLRSDQFARLHQLGVELRRLGYYRFQINAMIADLLGAQNVDELTPAEGDELLQRLQSHVCSLQQQRAPKNEDKENE